MAFGIDDSGFTIKRLPDIIDSLETELQAKFNALGQEINVKPDSVFGQLITCVAPELALIWEALEASYLAMYPDSAEGYNLDQTCQIVGVERLPATYSTVRAAIWGNIGTVAPLGFKAAVEGTSYNFSLVEAVTLIGDTAVTVFTVTAHTWTTYNIEVEGTDYDYVVTTPAPAAAVIAQELADLINADVDGLADATVDGADVHVISRDGVTALDVNSSTDPLYMEMTAYAWFGDFQADLSGPVVALAGTLNQIITPVAGVDSVENLVDADEGRATETDTELRIRREASLGLPGAATVPALYAHLTQDVEEIESCTVECNRTMATVGTLPAKSFRALIQAADTAAINQAIGEVIWAYQPAGIQSVGSEEVVVVDDWGNNQSVYFERPTPVPVWIRVTMTENTEQTFPTGGEAAIAAAILEAAQLLNVGDDVILGSFNMQIYAVPGVATAVIERSLNGSSWSTANLTIASTEQATFTSGHITVTMT